MVKVNVEDLSDAIEMVSSGESCGIETLAYVCVKTGKVWITGFDDEDCEDDDLPHDLDDNEQYIMAPDKRDLGLGRDLALDFVKDALPNEVERVYGYFRRKGAFGHFKRLLVEHDLVDEWYNAQQRQTALALARWGEEHQLLVG
jgi:hypothetical protein